MECRLMIVTPPSHLTDVLRVMHGFGCWAFDVLCDEAMHEIEPPPARVFVSARARAEVLAHLERELECALAGTGNVTVLTSGYMQ